jgi:hypothetical protein
MDSVVISRFTKGKDMLLPMTDYDPNFATKILIFKS